MALRTIQGAFMGCMVMVRIWSAVNGQPAFSVPCERTFTRWCGVLIGRRSAVSPAKTAILLPTGLAWAHAPLPFVGSSPLSLYGLFSLYSMNILRANASATKRAPVDYFTGTVWLDELTVARFASDVRAVRVTFEPGARTAWHTHPHGQLLQIVSGVGRVQQAGAAVAEVRPGDVIWFEPGERHWHGAAPQHGMVHLAVQRADEAGKTATWLEQVSETDYLG